VHANASSPSSAPRRRRHHAKGILGKRMCMHLLPGTNSTYVMMTRGCMHAPLSIKKVMSMQCVCMHPLAIIIKKYLSTPSIPASRLTGTWIVWAQESWVKHYEAALCTRTFQYLDSRRLETNFAPRDNHREAHFLLRGPFLSKFCEKWDRKYLISLQNKCCFWQWRLCFFQQLIADSNSSWNFRWESLCNCRNNAGRC
jgi:hypothetical protein